MFNLIAINRIGKSIELTNNRNYNLIDVGGLTPPKASINYSSIATSNISKFNNARLEPRNIVLTIIPEVPVEKNRINLYTFFRVGELVTISYKNSSRNVTIQGYVENVDGSLFTTKQEIQISILCLDPYFKDAITIIEELSQILSMFEFPFSIEEEGIPFSEIDRTYMQNVVNGGDAQCGMIVTLQATGNVTNPMIVDATNQGKFSLEISMVDGDLIRINTYKGQKSVVLERDGKSQNIIGNVAKGSAWFQLPTGENVFAYDADSGSEYLIVNFIHNDLYGGV